MSGLALALLASACSFTGGGYIPSAAGDGTKAVFAIHLDAAHPDRPKAQGTFHDRSAGVKLVIYDGVEWAFDGQCVDARLLYRSILPSTPGQGLVAVSACDRGEPGTSAGDELRITVEDGPFAGYENEGIIEGGNFQVHAE
jgi:hypothetical protein